ncbi:hypothetical protein [Prolixibacter denitrificans]|jgi:hypothetical protein|uniref:DUF493 domain-containing protein n=1 Tax=Prolixibacter denitrificans TaxID=1541063 RepID=A0A2P8C9I9_9BACT|nr:hypothetical protein [Prolixibacter denitrificans]PSK81637.1 hypothetical protein CLV93_10835 [Prolixibacter denitrificans]GET21162.1 DUF493 domain-containing protein [Prolixibacter denitrificans]
MDEKFRKLKTTLLEQEKWPLLYFFKFIVPNDSDKIEQVKELLPTKDNLSFRTSRDIRYIAISSKEVMPDADSIIDVYEKAAEIKGVIAL